MVTRNVILSAAKNLEKKGGTTDHEQGYFALYCVSVDCNKLMFAVRMPVRGIEPAVATKSGKAGSKLLLGRPR